MKYLLSSLREYIQGLEDFSLDNIVGSIETSIAEVENIERLGDEFKDIYIAKILDIKQHPTLKKLLVVTVDVGKLGTKTVVTGAKNINVGDYVPYIILGGKVPVNAYPSKFDGIIRKRKFGEIVSEGMLLSEYELGFSEDNSGILILPSTYRGKRAKAGTKLAWYLNLEDILIEIENKALTHRGDLFSILGFAYELAGILGLNATLPSWWYGSTSSKWAKLNCSISFEAPSFVKRYMLMHLKWLNRNTDLSLKVFHYKYGNKVHSNIVDFTNYLMLLTGQPVHAFDYHKLLEFTGAKGKEDLHFEVRMAKKGERLLLLNGEEVKFDKDHKALVISVNTKPVAIAGVMGGLVTAVDANTKEVMLEIATFSSVLVRRSMMSMGIFTDAGTIFSRQQDPEKIAGIAEFVSKHVDSVAGVIDRYAYKSRSKKIRLDLSQVSNFIGAKFNRENIKRLRNLGFDVVKIDSTGTYDVVVPSWRMDVQLWQDVAEEIVRIKGFNSIKLKPLQFELKRANVQYELLAGITARRYLSGLGLIEVNNYSFVGDKLYSKLGLKTGNLYNVVNAVSEEVKYMRSFLVPQFLSLVQKNISFEQEVAAFEIGRVFYRPKGYDSTRVLGRAVKVPREQTNVGIILWSRANRYSVFDLRRYVLGLLVHLGYDAVITDISNESDLSGYFKELSMIFNPHAVGGIVINDKIVGLLGILKSEVAGYFGIQDPVYVAELNLSYLLQIPSNLKPQYKVFKQPPVYQDLCFVVPSDKPYERLYRLIYNESKKIETEVGVKVVVSPIDIYIADGQRKNITFRLKITSDKGISDKLKTLVRDRIIQAVLAEEGVSLKSI